MSNAATRGTPATEAVPLRTVTAPSEASDTWTHDTVPLRLRAERAEEAERAERLRLLIGQRRARQR